MKIHGINLVSKLSPQIRHFFFLTFRIIPSHNTSFTFIGFSSFSRRVISWHNKRPLATLLVIYISGSSGFPDRRFCSNYSIPYSVYTSLKYTLLKSLSLFHANVHDRVPIRSAYYISLYTFRCTPNVENSIFSTIRCNTIFEKIFCE